MSRVRIMVWRGARSVRLETPTLSAPNVQAGLISTKERLVGPHARSNATQPRIRMDMTATRRAMRGRLAMATTTSACLARAKEAIAAVTPQSRKAARYAYQGLDLARHRNL